MSTSFPEILKIVWLMLHCFDFLLYEGHNIAPIQDIAAQLYTFIGFVIFIFLFGLTDVNWNIV